jgi:hypothetical protein
MKVKTWRTAPSGFGARGSGPMGVAHRRWRSFDPVRTWFRRNFGEPARHRLAGAVVAG